MERNVNTHTHILLSMRLCLELLLLLLLLLLLMLRQMFCRRGRLIICTFCCKDLLSFYADKRYTHILKRGLASSTDGILYLSQLFLLLLLSVYGYECESVAERERERETVTEAMQWNEVISVADLVIYHYFLMTPACVIQYLLRPLWVMATMWHWHSCINQGSTYYTASQQ